MNIHIVFMRVRYIYIEATFEHFRVADVMVGFSARMAWLFDRRFQVFLQMGHGMLLQVCSDFFLKQSCVILFYRGIYPQ